jgi:hypothetical protein
MSSPRSRQEFLDIAVAQGEAQIEPDRMLNDHRRKAVAAVGDFGHRVSVPAAAPPNYLVILTKPEAARPDPSPARERTIALRIPVIPASGESRGIAALACCTGAALA